MRDLFVALIVFGALPLVLRKPFLGILLVAGLGYLNPHRLCYGFMLTTPVVQIAVIATLVGMLISQDAKRMIWSREIVLLLIMIGWFGITTTQAFNPQLALDQYIKVIKIQIITVLTLLLLTSRQRVHLFIWAVVLSLAFYGVKGGIFTIVNGGAYRVQGPPGTFIEGNNELALALVMTIPLMRYLQQHEQKRWIKTSLAVGMFLTAVAAFGSQSRGALVALTLTGGYFWWNSRNKFYMALLIGVTAGIALSVMPQEWFDRMNTINTYGEDASAIGRINAWWTAYNLANDRFFGGGFDYFAGGRAFQMYAPDPNNVRAVHSIYFQMLGDHGWVGLVLFLTLLGLMWLKCGALIKHGKRDPQDLWVRDLGAMIQVSMVGYMSAGAFLGLGYFDYIYHLMAVVVVVHAMFLRTGSVAKSADVRPAEPPSILQLPGLVFR